MATDPIGWQPLWDPSIQPSTVTTIDAVTYSAAWEGCGTLLLPSITRLGNVVEIQQPIDAICFDPFGGYVQYDLGRFPPGQYSVHVVPCQHVFFPPCYPGEPPPDVTFSVIAAGAQGIPALDGFALATCCAGLMLIGMLRAARRSQVRVRPRQK